MNTIKEIALEVAKNVLEESKRYYKQKLVSFVIFGSVARDRVTPESDLDILIIVEDLPQGRTKRVFDFQENIEKKIERKLIALHRKGINLFLSPIIKTPQEVKTGSPLFLDMLEFSIILYDKDEFFKRYLKELKIKLKKLGSKKIVSGNAWYWILKPDYRYGDVIEL